MEKKLYWYWGVMQIATALLLLRGINNWVELIGFLYSHGLVISLTYLIFISLATTDTLLKSRIITRGFLSFLLTLSVIPLIGPCVALFLSIFLRFYPVYPVRVESFNKLNEEVLRVIQKRFEERAIPASEALLINLRFALPLSLNPTRAIPASEALLIRKMSRDDALKMIAIIGDMDWSANKSAVLRYMIRLSPYQNVVLMSIDLLSKKLDSILSEIAHLESVPNKDNSIFRRIANLYHEISYLDLCDPIMKPFYLKKACEYALLALKTGKTEDDALLSVKYLIEAERIVEAKEIYEEIKAKGDYFHPKWVAYEFELYLKLGDRESFSALQLLIETGGGVFIPEKVKEAAKAWSMILTSAWL